MKHDDPTSVWAYVHSVSGGAVAISLWETLHIVTYGVSQLVVYTVLAVVMVHAVHLHRKQAEGSHKVVPRYIRATLDPPPEDEDRHVS